ncbi:MULTISPECIES: NAD(P)/FAD-dependent oxidoreductase [Methylobacterium]|uniref:NAD(P)/FAD-dependent oxidoreductase n=1 Tax=Methylobacterium TaxID=407 RepID=UPI0013ECB11C|nr:NAD(P)/FAD-dependent oxidoreductase [Methylobacterium sp. DB0501]NGM33532.1 NAD(P)/FAD-dependent oxidoreductase [Methylobacterium sp. DB0501]
MSEPLHRTALESGPAAGPHRTPVPVSGPHRVVIVGGGFGGLTTARGLGGAEGIEVTLIDRRNHHLFQPLLYQVATAVIAPGEIAEPIRAILRRDRNVRVLMGEVEGIDVEGRAALLRDGTRIPYDTLVLATGATHSYFGHPEWERYAPGLKTLDDARRIRARVLLAFEAAEREEDPVARERLMTFAVIGGGPTGVEMAGAIAGLAHHALSQDFRRIDPKQARILLIEAAPRVLGTFSEDLSAYSKRALERLGVTVLTDHAVENVSEQGITVQGKLIPAATVVWGAGVRASPAGDWLGVETTRQGHVPVGPDLAVVGRPGIYALGDLAMAKAEDGTPLPGLAQVADQQGRYLGRSLRDRILHGKAPAPFRFRSRGNLAIIGRNAGVVQWDRVKLRGFPAWLVWGVAHVYLLVGFHNRLVVTLRWLWAYVSFQRGARLISERDEAVMALIRGKAPGRIPPP